jgi:hypothetical protein
MDRLIACENRTICWIRHQVDKTLVTMIRSTTFLGVLGTSGLDNGGFLSFLNKNGVVIDGSSKSSESDDIWTRSEWMAVGTVASSVEFVPCTTNT